MVSPNSFDAEGCNLQLAIRQAASGISNTKAQWCLSMNILKANVTFFSEYMNIFKFQQDSANQLLFYTLIGEEWVSFTREVGCEFSFLVLSFMIFMEINFNIEITDKITSFVPQHLRTYYWRYEYESLLKVC